MSDEPPKPRRPRVWGDDQRATIGRTRRTPPEGYPVHVEPELTPIEIRIDRLTDRVAMLATEGAVNSEAIDEFLKPAFKGVMARLDTLVSYHEKNQARSDLFYDEQWPAVLRRFESWDERLGRVERGHEKLVDRAQAVEARTTAVEAIGNSHGVRITALERHNEDTKLTTTAVGAERKRWFSWARAGFVAIGGAVAFVLSHIGEVVAWFRK